MRPLLPLLVGMMFVFSACTNGGELTNFQPTPSPPVSQDTVSPAYPGPVNAYPAPSSDIDAALQAALPPAELPTFPGQIAFQTERFGTLQVAILDGATGAVSRFNQNIPQTFEPSWSPDCSAVVFTVGQGTDSDFELYYQDLNSDNPMPFLNHPDFYDWSAAWSPAGNIIAYQVNRDALINICFADQTGNDLDCMSRGSFSNAMPAWSPDGSHLVFGSNREGNWELYLTDYPDMNTLVRLTNNQYIDFHPAFSPDGRTILFTSQRAGNYNLFTIEPNGQNEQQVSTDGGDERNPAWVGNDKIVYASGIDEEMELYLANADGSNPQRLTYSPGLDQWPAWCATP